MRNRTGPCVLTGKPPRMWVGHYHKGHMQCVHAAKRLEAEERYRPIAEAKAAAAKAAAATAAKAAAPTVVKAAPAKKQPRKRNRRPERKKASQR